MSKYLMSMALVGLGLPACGEESKTSGGGEEGACTSVDADINDKDGDFWPYCGEVQNDCDDSDPRINPGAKEVADGKDNDCDGKVDGIPPGADSELCGDGRTCQDGFQCGAETENPDICTCPQWMEGTWWVEFTAHAVDYEYDFNAHDISRQFWENREVDIQQDGCTLIRPAENWPFSTGNAGEGKMDPPPNGFLWKREVGSLEGEAWITFTGNMAPDNQVVAGTCSGTYPDVSTRPDTFFNVECSFTLTRRD